MTKIKKLRIACLILIVFGVIGLTFIIFGQGIARFGDNMEAIYACAVPALIGFCILGLIGVRELISLILAWWKKERTEK